MSRLIKKYKNRRLYDTEKSQYITIENVQKYVQDNIAFHVEEVGSGKDITNSILLQILVDMQSGPTQFLSSELLRQLIHLAHHPVHQSWQKILELTVANLQRQTQDQSGLNFDKSIEEWSQQMGTAFEQWRNLFSK